MLLLLFIRTSLGFHWFRINVSPTRTGSLEECCEQEGGHVDSWTAVWRKLWRIGTVVVANRVSIVPQSIQPTPSAAKMLHFLARARV